MLTFEAFKEFELVSVKPAITSETAVSDVIAEFGWDGEEAILEAASKIAAKRVERKSLTLSSPSLSLEFIKPLLQGFDSERFLALWLDSQNRVIEVETMFTGTIDGASVYPREVVKAAIQKGAGAVIFAHNHPSGITKPSEADKQITERLKKALDVIDVRILDHLIVGEDVTSFAERGLI